MSALTKYEDQYYPMHQTVNSSGLISYSASPSATHVNNFLLTHLDPFSGAIAPIPDTNMTYKILKSVRYSTNFNVKQSGDFLLVLPFHSPELKHRIYTWDPAKSRYCFFGHLAPDEDLTESFRLLRFISGGMGISSSTLSGTSFTLSGSMIGVSYQDLPNIGTLTHEKILSYKKDNWNVVAAVPLSEGIVATSEPSENYKFKVPETKNSLSMEDVLILKKKETFSNLHPATTLHTYVFPLEDIAPNQWGHMSVKVGFSGSHTGTTDTKWTWQFNITVVEEYADSAWNQQFDNHSKTFYVSSADLINNDLEYEWHSDRPVKEIRLSVNYIGTSDYMSEAVYDVTFKNFSYYRHGLQGPGCIVGVRGASDGMQVIMSGVSNYEAVPSSEVSRNVPTALGNGVQDPVDMLVTQTLMANQAQLGIRFVYSMKEYRYKQARGTFMSLSQRSSAMVHAAGLSSILGAVWKFAKPLIASAAQPLGNALGGALSSQTGRGEYGQLGNALGSLVGTAFSSSNSTGGTNPRRVYSSGRLSSTMVGLRSFAYSHGKDIDGKLHFSVSQAVNTLGFSKEYVLGLLRNRQPQFIQLSDDEFLYDPTVPALIFAETEAANNNLSIEPARAALSPPPRPNAHHSDSEDVSDDEERILDEFSNKALRSIAREFLGSIFRHCYGFPTGTHIRNMFMMTFDTFPEVEEAFNNYKALTHSPKELGQHMRRAFTIKQLESFAKNYLDTVDQDLFEKYLEAKGKDTSLKGSEMMARITQGLNLNQYGKAQKKSFASDSGAPRKPLPTPPPRVRDEEVPANVFQMLAEKQGLAEPSAPKRPTPVIPTAAILRMTNPTKEAAAGAKLKTFMSSSGAALKNALIHAFGEDYYLCNRSLYPVVTEHHQPIALYKLFVTGFPMAKDNGNPTIYEKFTPDGWPMPLFIDKQLITKPSVIPFNNIWLVLGASELYITNAEDSEIAGTSWHAAGLAAMSMMPSNIAFTGSEDDQATGLNGKFFLAVQQDVKLLMLNPEPKELATLIQQADGTPFEVRDESTAFNFTGKIPALYVSEKFSFLQSIAVMMSAAGSSATVISDQAEVMGVEGAQSFEREYTRRAQKAVNQLKDFDAVIGGRKVHVNAQSILLSEDFAAIVTVMRDYATERNGLGPTLDKYKNYLNMLDQNESNVPWGKVGKWGIQILNAAIAKGEISAIDAAKLAAGFEDDSDVETEDLFPALKQEGKTEAAKAKARAREKLRKKKKGIERDQELYKGETVHRDPKTGNLAKNRGTASLFAKMYRGDK